MPSANHPSSQGSFTWDRFRHYLIENTELGFRLDVSRMDFGDSDLEQLSPKLELAFSAMEALESGAIANPDENRQVGHYWLRAPELAPEAALGSEIEKTLLQIKEFAAKIHSGELRPPADGDHPTPLFKNLLLVGIGGSALGPQLLADALSGPVDPMTLYFIDNTDPDGIDRVLAEIGNGLAETLVLVISKSGGTKETRNGMAEVRAAIEAQQLAFAPRAVAVTGAGSQLDQAARNEGWLEIFPMWDWVGGRTSVTSAVGLLPMALLGIDIDSFLAGARQMDSLTRQKELFANPAAMLAAMWHVAGNGKGDRDMVVLPYKDRLLLLSRYLQQLVMESLGKELDLDGNVVNQGLAVYGNKGSTDQHAYVQQLREGPDNFFLTFIEVLSDRHGDSMEVEPGVTSGDYLLGFLLGTREALAEKEHPSITITIEEVSGRILGALIALFERSVGIYASLVGINAYHQPGVEAGKKAAGKVLAVQMQVMAAIEAIGDPAAAMNAEAVAAQLNGDSAARESMGGTTDIETVFHILEHLSANDRIGLKPGKSAAENLYFGC
jgi:glucose-6-phosphate isomerase